MWWVMLATPRPRPHALPEKKASKSTYMHIQETRHDTTRREETRRLDAIRRTHDKHNKTSTARHKHSRGQAQQDRHNTTGTTSHAQHDRHATPHATGHGFSPLWASPHGYSPPRFVAFPPPVTAPVSTFIPPAGSSGSQGLRSQSSLTTRGIADVAAGKHRHSRNVTQGLRRQRTGAGQRDRPEVVAIWSSPPEVVASAAGTSRHSGTVTQGL